MKTAIVYYSLNGNSEFVAKNLAGRLGGDLVRLECQKPYPARGPLKFIKGGKDAMAGVEPPLRPYTFDDTGYDLVVLACPVWADKVPPAINTFLRDHDLSGVRVALVVSSAGGSGEKCVADCVSKMRGQANPPVLSLRNPADGKDAQLGEKLEEFCSTLR